MREREIEKLDKRLDYDRRRVYLCIKHNLIKINNESDRSELPPTDKFSKWLHLFALILKFFQSILCITFRREAIYFAKCENKQSWFFAYWK